MENTVVTDTVEEVMEEVIERPYSLRKLKDGDLFPLLKILRKIGLKEFREVFNKSASLMSKTDEGESRDEFLKKVGIDVFLNMADTLISNLCKVEEDVYTLWADIAGVTVAELQDMEFGTLPLMIYDTFGEVKNTSFFKVLAKLL